MKKYFFVFCFDLDMFVKDACALMGLSIESPLTVAVNAGATALPSLLNIKQVCNFFFSKKTRVKFLVLSSSEK